MKYICEVCGYEHDDCPYPQENHCEFFSPKRTSKSYADSEGRESNTDIFFDNEL